MFANKRYKSERILYRSLVCILAAVFIAATGILPAFADNDRGVVTYTVVSGDTIEKIAKSFGTDTESLLKDNGLNRDDILHIGQQIIINNSRSSTGSDRSGGSTSADTVKAGSGILKSDDDGFISIDVAGADIRDVLSVIAMDMGVNIIYLETPVKVNFKATDITAQKALELLLQSLGNGIAYLRDKNVVIVGNQDKLQKDFFNQMALTRFRVSYITPEELGKQLDTLGVPVQKITMDKSSNYLWAQGTPQALAKVASVISALDRSENFDTAGGTIKSNIDLTPINLEYLTADKLEALMQKLGIKAQTIILDSNPKVLWVNGNDKAMADLQQLVAKVDIPESAGETFQMTSYKLKYLTYDKLISIVSQLKLTVDIVAVGSGQKALWLKGTQKDIDDLVSLISKVDISDNGEENQYFFYSLKYISPADASVRLSFLSVSGVTSMTLSYPQLSHELLIKCPNDMIGTVTRILGNVDVAGQKIKVPVDSGSNAYQLSRRRDLLSKLLNIPVTSMTVSENVSKTDTQYYVLWAEETPDNITKIKEMVKLIDSP